MRAKFRKASTAASQTELVTYCNPNARTRLPVSAVTSNYRASQMQRIKRVGGFVSPYLAFFRQADDCAEDVPCIGIVFGW